ncbi:hypothetical protein B0H11DRAFT_1007727 [Mycena galericulata]|nr:hypothetical protein B0H11DRAFT_1007727 [Mycena galericulata]
MFSSVLVLVPFILGINAANDWNVPCTTGQCEYDLPTATNASASGTVKIWGSTDAISDITTAAGWQILGCNSSALSQDLRLVCMNDPSDASSQCAHLYQGAGAVNKIVRLPENCGASAFARISNAWVPADQSIPASVKARVVRRSGTPPVVKALSIDTNFDAVDYSKTGPVNIAIQGANVPGAPNTIQIPGSRRRSAVRASRRGLGSLLSGALSSVSKGIDNAASDVKGAAESVGKDITSVAGAAATKVATVAKEAATDVKKVATKAATDVKNVATKAATDVKNVATKAATDVKAAATAAAGDAAAAASKVKGAAESAASDVAAATNNKVDLNHAFTLPPITFDKSANLINQAVQCGPVSASLNVDVDANANAQVTVTVAATGTLVPPKFTSFGVVAGMTATAAGTMTMTADVTGQVDSGSIQLVNIGIPGFDLPGLLTLGPSFQVSQHPFCALPCFSPRFTLLRAAGQRPAHGQRRRDDGHDARREPQPQQRAALLPARRLERARQQRVLARRYADNPERSARRHRHRHDHRAPHPLAQPRRVRARGQGAGDGLFSARHQRGGAAQPRWVRLCDEGY